MAVAAPAKPAAKSKTPPNSGNKKSSTGTKQKSPGRPKRSIASRVVTGYKTYSTGVTRNSPYTDPNVIFWVGIALIIVAGWTSGRWKNILTIGWNGGSPVSFLDAIKSTAAQLIFLFLMVVSARAVPALAKVWLIIIIGIATLWLIKNPQFFQLLSKMSIAGQANSNKGTTFVL